MAFENIVSKYQEKLYEAHSVIDDILYEAERGKMTWEEAFYQTKQELENISVEENE